MKKRLILLLTLATVAFAAAPVAMADHCFRCGSNPTGTPLCIPTTSIGGGFPMCAVTATSCILSGPRCPIPHEAINEDFAAELTVASVERLEAPKPAADEIRVASLETPPATR